MFGEPLDMSTVDVQILADRLTKFYCEARPQKSDTEELYDKNTLKNIRGAINRFLQDIGRINIDIVRDKEFKTANKTLDGLLKTGMASGMSNPTTHKAIISTADLDKIHEYLEGAASDPTPMRLVSDCNPLCHERARIPFPALKDFF